MISRTRGTPAMCSGELKGGFALEISLEITISVQGSLGSLCSKICLNHKRPPI